jgi:hypothetical protein
MSELVAFLDESHKNRYVVATVVASVVDLDDSRDRLRSLCCRAEPPAFQEREGGPPTDDHVGNVSSRRRRVYLRHEAQGLGGGSTVVSRSNCEDLSVSAVDRLVLDLAEGHFAADKRTLFEATRRLGSKMRYEHRRSKTEPMLWVPDAVAWCYSHRGDWWNIAKPIVRRVRDL